MSLSIQFYRPPRRVPTERTEEQGRGTRTRDIIILFGLLVLSAIILYAAGFVLNQMGLSGMALGVQLLALILVYVSLGVGITVAISYFVLESFLKREFRKKFERMDKEHKARLRQMRGYEEPSEESEDS
jgi:membrane protein implicated in regulation of membrane protease activity